MLNKKVEVAHRSVGDGSPVFTVVELGVCHEQDVKVAQHFIDVAKKNCANAVKVEAFQADNFVMDRSLQHVYGTSSGEVTENYYELLKRLELNYEQIETIKSYADKVDMPFFSTVHNNQDVDFCLDIDVCAFKIASVDITHHSLLEYLSTKDKPVFLDTGGSYIDEINAALSIFKKNDFRNVILMHNPTGYPAPADKTDLKFMKSLKSLLEVPVGFSCHTPGFDMVMASVAMGANVVEKPITRNRHIRSPEHVFSIECSELGDFLSRVRKVEAALGRPLRENVDAGAHARAKRRGIYAKSNLPKGHVLTERDFLFCVPNKGVSASKYKKILGKKLLKNYEKHEPFNFSFID